MGASASVLALQPIECAVRFRERIARYGNNTVPGSRFWTRRGRTSDPRQRTESPGNDARSRTRVRNAYSSSSELPLTHLSRVQRCAKGSDLAISFFFARAKQALAVNCVE